jgi:hypothetical protein
VVEARPGIQILGSSAPGSGGPNGKRGEMGKMISKSPYIYMYVCMYVMT